MLDWEHELSWLVQVYHLYWNDIKWQIIIREISTYHCLHVHPNHAVLSNTVVDKIAYLESCLPFEAVAGPDYTVSEEFFNMTIDLLNNKTWDENEVRSHLGNHFDIPNENTDTKVFDGALYGH